MFVLWYGCCQVTIEYFNHHLPIGCHESSPVHDSTSSSRFLPACTPSHVKCLTLQSLLYTVTDSVNTQHGWGYMLAKGATTMWESWDR